MGPVDWELLDLDRLADEVRSTRPADDAVKTTQAFEEALRLARLDPELLDYLIVAAVCLVARRDGSTPRTALETLFRRSVSDEEWRSSYLPLLA